MSNLSYMQKATDRGQLQIHVTTERGFFPIKDASIRLSYTGNPTEIIEELSTDISGQTAAVELPHQEEKEVEKGITLIVGM